MDKWQWSYWGPIILPSGKVTSCNMAHRWAWLFALSVMTFKFIQPKSTGPRPGWGWEKNKWKFLRKEERKAITYSLWEVHLQPPSLSQSTWIKPRFLHSSAPKKMNETQEQDWCLKQEAFPSWPTRILTMIVILCIIFTGTVKPSTRRRVFPYVLFSGLCRQTLTVGYMPSPSEQSISLGIWGPDPFCISMYLAPAPVPQETDRLSAQIPFGIQSGWKPSGGVGGTLLPGSFELFLSLTTQTLTMQPCWS